MHRVRITLANYRGFSDENPAVFELGGDAGFTALVGPNNSGKSSVIKFFYEFRGFFNHFDVTPHNNYGKEFFLNENYLPLPFGASGVSDGREIFFNKNDRDMRIGIEIDDLYCKESDWDLLKKVVFFCKNEERFHIKTKLYGCKRCEPLPRPSNAVINHSILDCSAFVETIRIFCKARYFGSFRNALNEGARAYFDMHIGTAFVEKWNQWKNSGNKEHADRIERVTADIERLFHFPRLEINASTDVKTLLVKIEGKTYRLEELGSGVAQFIVALGNAAMQSPSLLLIDEPEANLHPSLQQDFLLTLASYADEGVVFSTHSLGLARSVANDIYTVQYRDGRRTVRPFAATPNYAEFLGELSFSAFQDLGGGALLLVEGVNDVKTAHQFLRLFGVEHRVIVLPLGGNQFISADREAELGEIKRLSSKVHVLIDSERLSPDAQVDEKRVRFQETCGKLGFRVCVTERRAIENYFTERAIKEALGEKYRELAPYEKLENAEPAWRKAESWKIARLMTKGELEGTDIGQLLAELCAEQDSLGSPRAI